MAIDLALTQDEDTKIFDLSLVNGDFKIIDSFDTSLQVSLFADARADASEVPASERRRGWWGNQFINSLVSDLGSKLWLLEQSRRTQSVLNSAIDFARISLQWLVDEGHADDVEVSGVFLNTSGIRLTITIFRDQSRVETKFYDLWENTGNI